jgi:hypothetical protein
VALDEAGRASIVAPGLAAGTHTITATYKGSASFLGSSNSLAQTVQRTGVVITADPAVVTVLGPANRLYLTFTARMTTSAGQPIAGRTLTFRTGTALVCSAVTNAEGVATCGGIQGALAAVPNGYTASFAGDAVFSPGSAHGGLVRVLDVTI